MISKYYWNKKIDLYEYSKHKDENGATRKGYEKIIYDMKCNVQPYSMEKATTSYGYNVECTNRVFCDVNSNIKESSIIVWNNKTYTVQKIVPWNDYYILLIFEEEVDLNE